MQHAGFWYFTNLLLSSNFIKRNTEIARYIAKGSHEYKQFKSLQLNTYEPLATFACLKNRNKRQIKKLQKNL